MAVARDRLFWDQQDAEAEIAALRDRIEFLETFARLQIEELIEAYKRPVGPPQKRKLKKRRIQQLKAAARKRTAAGQSPYSDSPMYRGWIRQALLAHKIIREKRNK